MQAGLIASAYGRSGRHLRFITLASALVIVDLSLWVRLATANGTQVEIGDMVFATLVATAAIAAMLSLWRNPLDRNTRMMATPALRQQLATHHAGHIVSIHVTNPDGVTRADMTEPCSRHHPSSPVTTQSLLRAELVTALSGMAAEEIFSGESGSHVEQDLARATAVGADMVGRLGMSGSLVSLQASRPNRSTFVQRVLDDTRTRKDLESVLRETKREAIRLMLENRPAIIALRDALLRSHRLSADQIREIITQADATRSSNDEVLVDLRIVTDRTQRMAATSRP